MKRGGALWFSVDPRSGGMDTREGRIKQDAFIEDFDHTMVIGFVSIMMDVRMRRGRILQRANPNDTPSQCRGQRSEAPPVTFGLEQTNHAAERDRWIGAVVNPPLAQF